MERDSGESSGITIPWFDGDRLALVKIRRPEGSTPKYAEAYRDRPPFYPAPRRSGPASRWYRRGGA